MASPAAVLSILVRANTAGAAAQLTRLNQQTMAAGASADAAAKKHSRAGRMIGQSAKYGALAVGALAYASLKASANYEQSLNMFQAVTRATRQEMAGVGKLAKRLGADVKLPGASAADAAQAMTQLAKGGLSVKDSMQAARGVLQLAAAAETDVGTASTITARALNAFGLEGRKAGKVVDLLAAAANASTVEITDIAFGMQMSSAAAAQMKIPVEDLTNALGLMANAGIAGSDAGTSLKTMFARFTPMTNKAADAMTELGIMTESGKNKLYDAQGQFKGIRNAVQLYESALAKLNPEQRQQAIYTIFGSDAMRAANIILGKGSAAWDKMKERVTTAGEAQRIADAKMKGLKGTAEAFKSTMETLGITIGTALTPVAEQAIKAFTRFGGALDKIMSRKDLTFGEKLQASLRAAGDAFGPMLRKWGKALQDAQLGEKLTQAVNWALPRLADAMAAAAPKAALAFVNGWMNAGVWGRLIIGGWLLKRLGGFAAFTAIGTKAGAAFGGGMAAGTAGAVAAGGLAGGAAKGAKGGKGIGMGRLGGAGAGAALGGPVGWGIAGAFLLGPELVKPFTRDNATMSESMGKVAKKAREMAGPGLEPYRNALRQMAAQARRTGTAVDRELAGNIDRMADRVTERLGPKWTGQIRANFQNIVGSARATMPQIASVVRTNTQIIRERLGKDSGAGRKALAENFRLAAQAVKRQMKAGVIDTQKGSRQIREYLIQGLVALGLNRNQAESKLKRGTVQGGRRTPGLATMPGGSQRGGPISIGKPVGDSVAALLEKGEYVLNRNAVRKVGVSRLDALNYRDAPRFQGGGIVGLGRQLQRQGYQVGEHPAFGGVGGGHSPTGYHPKGMAIDVNADGRPGGEARWLDRLYARLKNMPGVVELLWRVKDHFDHLHVAMSGAGGILGGLGVKAPKIPGVTTNLGGGPGAMANRALAVARSAAQGVANRVAATMGGEGAETIAGGGSARQNIALGRRMAAARGWTGAQWDALYELWTRESGWRTTADNPTSDAYGIPQALPGSKMASAGRDWASNAATQIKWGLGYIAERYGSPAAALAFHNAHNWYQRGGLVGMQGGGDPFRSRLLSAGRPPRGAKAMRPETLARMVAATKKRAPKLRRQAVDRLLGRLKGISVPKDISDKLKWTSTQADVYGEYADRAMAMSTEDADGNPVPYKFQGKDQAGWITSQLEAMFARRNAIIALQEWVVRQRKEVAAAIERARAIVAELADRIRRGAEGRRMMERQLEVAQKNPKKNKNLIRLLKGGLRDNAAGMKPLVGMRDELTKRVLPKLGAKRTDLAGLASGAAADLLELQGVGSPTNIMPVMPAVGVFGGAIFDAQMRLRDLTQQVPKVTDTSNLDSARLALAEERLAMEVLQNRSMQAGMATIRSLQTAPLPAFAGGGVAPGGWALVGERGPELAHLPAGSRVYSNDQSQGMLNQSIHVIVQDGAVDPNKIRVIANGEAQAVVRRDARYGVRRLPGAGS